MKKTLIIIVTIALIAVSLMGCDGTQSPGVSGNKSTSDIQVGDQLEVNTGLSAGSLRMTVTDVSLITDGADLPPKEFFLEQYDRYVSSDGSLKEGSCFVVLDLQIESIDAAAELDLNNEDPYLFRADSLLTLVDLTEKQSKNYYYQNINYFSLFGSNEQHPFAFNLNPGDSIEFSIGFFVGNKKDGSERDLSQLRACTSSGNPKSDFIDLNLDEITSE